MYGPYGVDEIVVYIYLNTMLDNTVNMHPGNLGYLINGIKSYICSYMQKLVHKI